MFINGKKVIYNRFCGLKKWKSVGEAQKKMNKK
jgi:hypothetical protein